MISHVQIQMAQEQSDLFASKMEEWITAHESLRTSSKDPQEGVKQEFTSKHDDSSTKSPHSSSSSSSSSVYYSPRAESMIDNKSKFKSELEFNIEYSKVHWSQLANTDSEGESDTEYSPEGNLEHFERLKAQQGWGEFFRDLDSLVVGEKIGEGAQAEIYAATLFVDNELRIHCAVKVFKEGYALRDLQRQWPNEIKWFPRNSRPRLLTTREMYDPEAYEKAFLDDEKAFFDERDRIRGYLRRYYDDLKYTADPFDGLKKREPLHCIYGGTLLKDEGFKNRFAFVMNRQWGDLRKLIDAQMLKKKNHGPPFPPKITAELMFNIARDMRNLHQGCGIVHRDLKASNVLLGYRYEEVTSLATTVVDFECSVGVVGTAFWRAPEILQQLKDRIPTSKIRFSFEADIYSYGMTCYEIVTGRIPFEGYSLEQYDAVLNGERPELPLDLDPILREIITNCWHPDPSQRPFFCDIVDDLGKGGVRADTDDQSLLPSRDSERVDLSYG